jgi:transcription initiation factor TFIID subunit 6
MTTDDIDQAFRVLNIEPLYGHSPHNPPTFRRAIPYPPSSTAGTLYFVEDEEIDFDRVLREEKITLPKPVSWTAHWLAVEGVQPLIPENPPAITKDTEEPSALKSITGQPSTSALTTQATVKGRQQNQQLVKQVLSRELQLYYARLTSSLLPPAPAPEDHVKKTAALASLRHDAGLQALLPYLVRWVAEGVVNTLRAGSQSDVDGRVLEVFLDVISALLDNSTLFVEPYVSSMWHRSDCLLIHLLSVTPNAASGLVYSAAFIVAAQPLDPPSHISSTNDVAPPDATFYNVPFFSSSHHEDLASGAGFYR